MSLRRQLATLALGGGLCGAAAAASFREQIEADWLRQAQAWHPRPSPTQADAAGAVDGVKDGKYAFHTGQEPNPWWQVDLGAAQPLARLVVFNRLDYAPGLHNADTLRILVSDDARAWRLVHDQAGRHFGGVSGAPPLEVNFKDGETRARFVRLQVRSDKPIFFHLDEVEIYGPADPAKNLALHRPADQSSVSIWSTSKLPPPKPAEVVTPEALRHFLERGRRLATELRHAGLDTAEAEAEFRAIEATLGVKSKAAPKAEIRSAAAESPLGGPDLSAIYLRLRRTLRGLAFANPLLNFDRLLFVKRFCQETYPDVCLNHMPWVSRPGGDLCILTLTGPEGTPAVRTILNGALGPGHVHGLDLSWDGQRIVFGYAKARSNQPPAGWLDRAQSYRLRRTEEPIHLFEVGVDGTGLRQLTFGEWSDLDPTYAPNGDIVFVSERCATSLQCNEYDKDETSCNLYVMRPDGSGIRRLSVSKDGDYLPHTLEDGTIGYTRWEYHERSWAYIQSLWTVRPDGTQADALFKQHFVNPWALEDVRSIPGTRNQKLVCVAAGHHTLAAGPVVIVTPGVGINEPRGISIVTPGVVPPEGGMDGVPVAEGGVRDAGGYYMHPWALSEKTFLAAYSYGTGKTGLGSEIDPTGYALYLIDVFGTKELLCRDPDISCFTPLPLRPRPRPPVLPDRTILGQDASCLEAEPQHPPGVTGGPAAPLPSTGYATCVVTTVSYGCDGIAPERIKWLRVAEPIGWPYDHTHGGQRYGEDHRYGGPGAERKNLLNWTPIRVLGDVPVEPDGSAHFRVPADTAVYFQILDEDRMELRRMRSFISFQPGETRACTGCHESRTVTPVPPLAGTEHGRDARAATDAWLGHPAQASAPGSDGRSTPLALLRPASDPQPPPWGDRPVSFLRDVQPILDRHCVSCHSGLKPAGGLDFFGGLTSHDAEVPGYGCNRAYETILEKGLVSSSAVRAQDASITPPLAYGSLKSKLAQAAQRGRRAGRYPITDEEWRTLTAWIDANAPYHDRFVNKRAPRPAYDLPADRALLQSLSTLHERRCAGCHTPDEVIRLDWIDLHHPARSLFLLAPLANNAGGSAKCGQAIYADQTDADYRAACEVVAKAVARAWAQPRRDVASLEASAGQEAASVSAVPSATSERSP